MFNLSRALSYSFNWMAVNFSLYLVIFGYYAAITPKLHPLSGNAAIFAATTFGPLLISWIFIYLFIYLFIYFAKKKLKIFEDTLTLSVEDIKGFLSQ